MVTAFLPINKIYNEVLAQALVDQIANQLAQADLENDQLAAATITVSQDKRFEAAQELMKLTSNINQVHDNINNNK